MNKSLIMVSHNGAAPIPYLHKIEPVFHKGSYLPNNKALKDARQSSSVNILPDDFDTYQRKGLTIIINGMGGWCFLTEDSKVVN